MNEPDPVGDDDDTIDTPTGETGDTFATDTPPDPTPRGAYGVSMVRFEKVALVTSVLKVTWTQEAEATVAFEFEFAGETRRSPARTLGPGEHDELLLGIPYETDVVYRVVLDGAEGQEAVGDYHARTGHQPNDLPEARVEVSDPSGWDADTAYVLTAIDEEGGNFLGGFWWDVLVDRQGRVVWAVRSEPRKMSFYPRVAVDGGSFLLDRNSYWGNFDGGNESQIVELLIDGTELNRWDVEGLHHSFTQLPDRTLVYGSYLGGLGDYQEEIRTLGPTGERDVLFSCRPWLDQIGELKEVCGSNTVSYHEAEDSVVVSWFTFEAITEIDRTSKEVTRTFGHVNTGYGFVPESSAFWYQHGPHYLENGHLLLSTHASANSTELVVREYEVDDSARVLRQVWSAGEGERVSGDQMGEAHRLANGNTLHNFGTNSHLREYTPDGRVVWEIDWRDADFIGRSEPVGEDLWAFAPERR